MSAVAFDTSGKGWISRGFEQLVDEVEKNPAARHFDVLIVGSGYGGAVAADTFADLVEMATAAPLRVGVLERGNEYLSGAFPKGLAELPKHVRMERQKEGLFDVRLGPEVATVVASGVGGGSLINAGVMEVPLDDVFATRWPAALSAPSGWSAFYDRARELLGASHGGDPNTILDHPDPLPAKFASIKALASPPTFRPAAITIAMTDGATSTGNVQLTRCRLCGDCAMGCNLGAKESLDVNLLVRAHHKGARIYSGATVLRLERDDVAAEWIVHAVHTSAKLRRRLGGTVQIRASKVVLAAGTLGSTEILLRSRSGALRFSTQLGRRCSTNGDMLVVDYDTDRAVNAVADEAVAPSQRRIGPTITGVVDLRQSAGVLIEEMAVPAGLARAFAEVFGTVNALHSLELRDGSRHRRGFPTDDVYSIPRKRIERSALYAVMGDDGAAGTIELDGAPTDDRDGIARIRWEGLQYQSVFDEQVDAIADLTQSSGGRVLPNPVWKLLPKDMAWLLDQQRGPLTTVHPLGGCAMGDSVEHAVVDEHGCVFDPGSLGGVHDGLVVLDGSIIPTALGTNPALTITALALRAAEALRAEWGYVAPAAATAVPAATVRPVFRATDVAAEPAATEVQVIERLAGRVKFRAAAGAAATRIVELTLRFAPKAVADLTYAPHDNRKAVLHVDSGGEGATASRIRVYDEAQWRLANLERVPTAYTEQRLDAIALLAAPLSGSVSVFERQKSWSWVRTLRAGAAYLANRGLRDTWQAVADGDDGPGFFSRFKSGLALASRSGEVRALFYDLTIGTPEAGAKLSLSGQRIRGHKRFTYARRANPWRQLMEVRLDAFPGLAAGGTERVLKLDPQHLARVGVPLLRVTKQADGVTAAAELISFVGYLVRLLLGIHIWSFRSPDAQKQFRKTEPLPGTIPDAPAPQIHDLYLGDEVPAGGGDPAPVHVRLARYARPASAKNPIVMIHGYSASGTTFAHHAVQPSFASWFFGKDRDVWVVDLRTSSGMPTATLPWSFEQVAYRDVPAAIAQVFMTTGKQVDVIAHCMGAVVFSMALLHADEATADVSPDETLEQETARRKLKERVRRVAFTQVGPLVVLSPANVFRGYALSYLKEFLPDRYTFNPGPDASLADNLWDRLLATLPYPEEEFDVENPRLPWRRTEWVRTRHRMDALYGRDFSVRNMSPEVLRHIDDHFGALSLETVSQTIHFARFSMITNRAGRNVFVARTKLGANWGDIPTLSIHGRENGLSDVSTVYRMKAIFEDAGRVFIAPQIIDGAGHQDALIGSKRFETLGRIEQFLDAEIDNNATPPLDDLVAYTPWIGPIVTEEPPAPAEAPPLSIRLGTRPTHRAAEAVVMLRVAITGNVLARPDDPMQPWDFDSVVDNMVVYASPALRQNHWDAFLAPQPPALTAAGNALLVLVVYDEAPVLHETTFGHFAMRRDVPAAGPYVTLLDPRDWSAAPRPEVPRGIPRVTDFRRFARTVLKELETQPAPSAELAGKPRGSVHNLTLIASTDTAEDVAPTTRSLTALPSAPVPLVFARKDQAGQAVLDRLVEEDRDLMNGVIPDRSPPTADTTAFAVGSCQYPAGFLDEPVAYDAYGRVVSRLDGGAGITPRFAVLTGDQVYVDPTAGLYDPTTSDDPEHDQPYHRWLRHPHVRSVLRRVPSFMILDDHEIADNWEPISMPDDPANAGVRRRGLGAFRKFQRGIDNGAPSLSRAFTIDGFPFFMLDTRSERPPRNVTNAGAAELAGAAMAELEAWLGTSTGPKFVVTPAMLLPRHRSAVRWSSPLSALHSDGWDGYPRSLHSVLARIVDDDIEHVVFLSGDEHRGCVAAIEVRKVGTPAIARIHSLHTPGAYAPFPFANSLEEDYIADPFEFMHGAATYRCKVEAGFPPGANSLTLLRPRKDGAKWHLDYEYAEGDVRTLEI